MNFIVFISLSLIFSTIVLAFPQEQLVGGVSPTDHNSPEIKRLAQKALDHFTSSSGSSCKHKLNRILSAKTQVVQGSLTKLKLEICPDACGSGANNTNKCKICNTDIWEKTWENFSQVQKFECAS